MKIICPKCDRVIAELYDGTDELQFQTCRSNKMKCIDDTFGTSKIIKRIL